MTEIWLAVLALVGALSVTASIVVRRMRRRGELTDSLEERAIRAARLGAWSWDPRRKQLAVSDGWLRFVGLPRSDFGNTLEEWTARVHPSYRASLTDAIEDALRKGRFHCDLRMRNPTGGYSWVSARGGVERREDGSPRRLVGVLTDINSAVEVERQVLDDAYLDRLTGLPNRHSFERTLESECRALAMGGDRKLGLLFMDLNRFKQINDRLGHGVGDALLAAVAVRLERNRRPGDTVARLGGDEFVVLLRGIDDEEQCLRIARRLHDVLVEPYRVGTHELSAGASIGVALNLGGSAPEQMLRDADMAMYRAKAADGGVSLFSREMQATAAQVGRLQSELSEAAEQGLFELHYQPIVSLEDGELESVEALLRWRRGRRERIAAGEFIGLAEEAGLVAALDRLALEQACRRRVEWLKGGLLGFRIAVNVSGQLLADENFDEDLTRLFKETGLPSELLELEANEAALSESLAVAPGLLERIAKMNVGLVIDDFGLGDLTLRDLNRLPVSGLKFDAACLAALRPADQGRSAVRGALAMARELGMRVTVKGLEDPGEVRTLADGDCDLGQGYYFARPMSATRFESLLREDRLGEPPIKQPGRSLWSRATSSDSGETTALIETR